MFKDFDQTWGQAAGEIIIMLLVAFILGYLLKHLLTNRNSNPDSNLEGELSSLRTQNSKLKTELDLYKKSSENMAFAANAPAADIVKDDLKKIEGIGPKIQDHLNNGGIYSFAQLASTPVSRIQEILDAAGPAYTIHNPSSWPKQSAMAAAGKWDELNKWQGELKGGK